MTAVQTETHYEILLSNGDRAEADSLEAIVLAGHTLCQDLRDAGRWLRKPTATFLRDGRCILADVPESLFPRVSA